MKNMLAHKNSFPTTLGDLTAEEKQEIQEFNEQYLEYFRTNVEVAQVMKSLVEDVDLMMNILLALQAPSGYAAASILDTNKDNSDGITFMTFILGGVIDVGATYLIGKAMGKNATIMSGIRNTIAPEKVDDAMLLTQMLKEDASEKLDYLKTLNQKGDLTPFIENIESIIKIDERSALVTKATYIVSGLANAYHGYKRNNDSIGYGLAWAFTGLIGTGMALKQGFAKPVR